MKWLLYWLLSLISTIAFTDACSCGPIDTKDAYCKADWVAQTKILTQKVLPNQGNSYLPSKPNGLIQYEVSYEKIFKIPPLFNGLLPKTIHTPIASSLCGLKLIPGKTYLLAGTVMNNTLTTNICGQLIENIDLTLHDAAYVQNIRNKLNTLALEPCSTVIAVSKKPIPNLDNSEKIVNILPPPLNFPPPIRPPLPPILPDIVKPPSQWFPRDAVKGDPSILPLVFENEPRT